MMKLLLAIDGSTFSAAPVRAAVTRPWPSGSVIRVLTVVETPLPMSPEAAMAADAAGMQQALRDEADTTVRRVREIIEKSGLPVETRIREGHPGRQIVEEAKDWGADLVLMGSHGRTGLKRVLMGSVAQYVVSHARCSVEVVREIKAERAETAEREIVDDDASL